MGLTFLQTKKNVSGFVCVCASEATLFSLAEREMRRREPILGISPHIGTYSSPCSEERGRHWHLRTDIQPAQCKPARQKEQSSHWFFLGGLKLIGPMAANGEVTLAQAGLSSQLGVWNQPSAKIGNGVQRRRGPSRVFVWGIENWVCLSKWGMGTAGMWCPFGLCCLGGLLLTGFNGTPTGNQPTQGLVGQKDPAGLRR